MCNARLDCGYDEFPDGVSSNTSSLSKATFVRRAHLGCELAGITRSYSARNGATANRRSGSAWEVTRTGQRRPFAAVRPRAQAGASRSLASTANGSRWRSLPLSNVPVRIRGTLHWTSCVSTAMCSMASHGGPNGEIDSVGVDSWESTFGCSTSPEGSFRPVTTATRAEAAMVDGVLRRVAPRELYERTGIQLLRIKLPSSLSPPCRPTKMRDWRQQMLLLIPDLFHYWLCGPAQRAHERELRRNASMSGRVWAIDLLEQLGIRPIFSGGGRAGTRLGSVSDDSERIVSATVVAGGHA